MAKYDKIIEYTARFWDAARDGVFGTSEEVIKMLASLGDHDAQEILKCQQDIQQDIQ